MSWKAIAAAVAVVLAALVMHPAGAQTDTDAETGPELFVTGCSSCHGQRGGGVAGRGPALTETGEAAAYYYLQTGRMPLANPEETPRRKEPVYDDDQIAALVEYVGSLGEGPTVPDIDPAAGDLAEGGELFRGNCAPCHSAAGVGGALSYGRAAPNIHPADPSEIAAAVRAGPGQMPVFGDEVFDQEQLDSLVRYADYLDQPDDRGGLPLGRVGPIPEGFVTWVVGIGTLLGVVAWIGTRRPEDTP